jgi:hypothetical protein
MIERRKDFDCYGRNFALPHRPGGAGVLRLADQKFNTNLSSMSKRLDLHTKIEKN